MNTSKGDCRDRLFRLFYIKHNPFGYKTFLSPLWPEISSLNSESEDERCKNSGDKTIARCNNEIRDKKYAVGENIRM